MSTSIAMAFNTISSAAVSNTKARQTTDEVKIFVSVTDLALRYAHTFDARNSEFEAANFQPRSQEHVRSTSEPPLRTRATLLGMHPF
jgi:hypothetical protein